MRVLFAGSPEAALPSLQWLVDDGRDVCAVVTQPPRPVGRRGTITPTPVATWALAHGLVVRTPASTAELREVIAEVVPDIALVVAYGRILEGSILEQVQGGWWNAHFSLLPRHRGAAPVQHALLAGDTLTGISVFRIVPELDAGPIFGAVEQSIAPHDTAGTLLRKLAARTPELFGPLLEQSEAGPVSSTAQMGTPTLAPKLQRLDGFLDPSGPATELYRRYQATTPEPGATLVRSDNGGVVKVLRMWPKFDIHALGAGEVQVFDNEVLAGCSPGAVVLDEVLPVGKRPMSGIEWYRGLPPGVRLGKPGR